jgi:hypothetical protein
MGSIRPESTVLRGRRPAVLHGPKGRGGLLGVAQPMAKCGPASPSRRGALGARFGGSLRPEPTW